MLGKIATVASLVMKIDPVEGVSDPLLLTHALLYLLGDINAKMKIGIRKFTEESITLYLTSPFRQSPRPPLVRESRGKAKASAEAIIINVPGTCTTSATIRVGALRKNAAIGLVHITEIQSQSCSDWNIGDLVWVMEGTEPGVRGYRAEKYKGIIERVLTGSSSYVIKPVLGVTSRTESSPHLTKASMSGFAELSGRGSSSQMPISVKKAINSAEKSRKAAEINLVIETEKREAAETKAKKERSKAAAEREQQEPHRPKGIL